MFVGSARHSGKPVMARRVSVEKRIAEAIRLDVARLMIVKEVL